MVGTEMKRVEKEVALVIGGSRGIGRQVSLDLARSGYHVVVAAKSTSNAYTAAAFPPDPNSSQSTINTVVREIREAGGDALALPVDVRDFDSIRTLIDETVRQLGALEVLVYNSGAIWWASVEDTPMKRFQLMQKINPEGLKLSVFWIRLLADSRRSIRLNTSCSAALAAAGLESTNHRCFATHIFTFLSRKNRLRNGQDAQAPRANIV